MAELSIVSALGHTMPQNAIFGALSVMENSGLALASLSLSREAAQPAPYGLQLPQAGRWLTGQEVAAFWTGPGQWMIEAEGRAQEDFARALKAEVPQAHVTEQTDGWACFEIASSQGGVLIAALLEKLVNLDATAFVPGSATRTGLDHMPVFVIRRAENRLAVMGMRSSAASLWHALITTMRHLQEMAK